MEEQDEREYCRFVPWCQFDPVVSIEGKGYCRLHNPARDEKIVLYRTYTGQLGDWEPVTVRARVVYLYSEKPDHIDLELLEVHPGQVVHNARYDATLRAGWCWPGEEVTA